MEAIAAAGALPGLASATIQLGTATFQFYQQLHSLYKAIKHGENDLNTAARRLGQHGDFIKELRFNFERISDPGISASTRDLFERYITDSEAEVEEFKNLLDKVGKKHFKRKTLQAVETGSRLRFHERSIQKYCDLLDKQMQRFLFLQSAAQSMRVESTLAEVMETLVEQGVKAVAFYDEQSSSRTNNEEPHSPSGTHSNNTRLSLRGVGRSSHNYRTTPCFQQDLIPNHSSFLRRKVYPTLCGTVTVGTYSNLTRFDDKDCQCYRIWFKPYSWISRALVEWRCLINSAHTIPTLMLSVTTSIICDDPDVLDALGFSPRFLSYSAPNPTKIRAVLDAGRLRKEHIIVTYQPEDILSWCLNSLVGQHRCRGFLETKPRACHGLASRDSLQQHLDYYGAIALLLSRGFEPTLSSWQRVYYDAVKYHWHVSRKHPELMSTIFSNSTITSLVTKKLGHSIPLEIIDDDLSDRFIVWYPEIPGVGGTVGRGFPIGELHSGPRPFSHFGHLITQEFSAERIRKEIPDLDLIDLADEQFRVDRWLLGLFAPFRPEIATLLKQYLKSYKSMAGRSSFDIEYIREEFKRSPDDSNRIEREALLTFICSYGNAAILQQLDTTSLAPTEIALLQVCAAQISNQGIFDLVISRGPADLDWLPHADVMRDKLATDPLFVGSFARSLIAHNIPDPLSAVLLSDKSIHALLMADSPSFSDYIWNLIVYQVQQYEARPTAAGCTIIPSLVYETMVVYWELKKSSEYLLRDLRLYDILNLLVRSPAFDSSLDALPSLRVRYGYGYYRPHPSVKGYTALMIALHCGMKPAVQILVDAGASILKIASCGKSALSVARENTQAQHPRQCVAHSGRIHEQDISLEFMWVSESVDKEMLEVLLEVLRDRGEVDEEVLEEEQEEQEEVPESGKWRALREKARYFARWLFRPSYTFDSDHFRENSIYAVLVSALWFLSVLKVLKVELGEFPSHTANMLSRPVVILAVVMYFSLYFWR